MVSQPVVFILIFGSLKWASLVLLRFFHRIASIWVYFYFIVFDNFPHGVVSVYLVQVLGKKNLFCSQFIVITVILLSDVGVFVLFWCLGVFLCLCLMSIFSCYCSCFQVLVLFLTRLLLFFISYQFLEIYVVVVDIKSVGMLCVYSA